GWLVSPGFAGAVGGQSLADTGLKGEILLGQVGNPAGGLLPACFLPTPPRHIVLRSCGLQPSSCPDVAPPFDAPTFSPNYPAPGLCRPRRVRGPTIPPRSPARAAHDLRKPSHSRGPRRYRPHRPRPTCFHRL